MPNMNQKSLQTLQKTWTKLGSMDPLWAILSDPSKENGRWKLDEFFNTGMGQLKAIQDEISQMDCSHGYDRCLDFGCGIGRMSRAFGTIFKEVHGVDIASSMIREAKKHHQDYPGIHFHHNRKSDLKLFPNDHFNFIFSHIVLQHIPPEITDIYLREFVRVLKPGGLLAFQLTSHRRRLSDKLHFNARITCNDKSRQYPGGTSTIIKTTVANIGESPWPTCPTGEHPFRLGNHWYDQNGETTTYDDGRCDIPFLMPGESCDLALKINTPVQPGKYWLVLDVVQEHVTWFENAGSQVIKIPVEIVDQNNPCDAPDKLGFDSEDVQTCQRLHNKLFQKVKRKIYSMVKTQKPQYEMHGIEKEEVLRILTDSGGKLIKVRDDFSAGADWMSYYYFASKEH
jgi:ubiquinone/menaquinone biosynthesis C-methylase UbiE